MAYARVTDNTTARRYELWIDGTKVGLIHYRRSGDTIVLTHTQVATASSNQGYGGQLVQATLTDLRERGLSVRVVCPFIKSWLENHHEFDDLDLETAT